MYLARGKLNQAERMDNSLGLGTITQVQQRRCESAGATGAGRRT
jgi:hypothetical protein